MDRRDFLKSHAAVFSFAAEALLGGGSVTLEYLWGVRRIDGEYEVSKHHNPGIRYRSIVPVRDTIMARRMQRGDLCLLRRKGDGTWEVVLRHTEGGF